MLIGNQVFGRLMARYTTGPEEAPVRDWEMIWAVPAGFAMAVLVVFVLLFSGKAGRADDPAEG